MKSVLISIQPKWCELIASGKKTVEVRKTRPKLETPFKVYIYCSKGFKPNTSYSYKTWAGYGKVIGEFVCDRIDYWQHHWTPDYQTIQLFVGNKFTVRLIFRLNYFSEVSKNVNALFT